MIKLSHHAEQQIDERGIHLAWVEATVTAPEWTEKDPIVGRTRLFRPIPEFGGRVLRVVVETTGAGDEVVTAYFDRAATRRRRRP
jgi:hypothetical protein